MITPANRLLEVEEYYFSRKLREVAGLIAEGKPVINMGIGSPDMAPAPGVMEAMMQSMQHPKAHQYQSYQGIPELREAIARFYERYYGVNVSAATEVLPLMGSKEGIMHISMAFLNEGDEVLIPNPGYPTYTSVTRLVGAVPRFYELEESRQWWPDLEALEAQDLSKVKLMWVNYPHMPTGANANEDVYRKLIDFARRHSILVVNDNPYSFILNENPKSILSIPGATEVALELNSLSKTFNMAGWRVGFVLGAKQHLDAVLRVKSNMDSGMFYGIQCGAVKALELDQDWFSELNGIYARRREGIYALAERLNCRWDEKATGLFVWAKLPEGIGSEAFVDEVLYDKHLFITPGTVFGSKGEGYIRFSLCVSENQIKEALSRWD